MDALRNTLRRYLVDEPYRRLPPDELWGRFRDDRDEAAFRVWEKSEIGEARRGRNPH